MSKFDNLLAIDTSSPVLRLGVMFGGDRLVKSEDRIDKSHGQLIMKHIDDLMQSAGMKQVDLQGLVVCLGPGSFTGLRIGLAVGKGIVTALDLQLVGVNLFEIAEHRLGAASGEIGLIMPYRSGEVIISELAEGRVDEAGIDTRTFRQLPDWLTGRKVALIGLTLSDLAAVDLNRSLCEEITYDAADLIEIGRKKLSRSGGDDLEKLEPCYLKKSQAEIKFDERQRHQ